MQIDQIKITDYINTEASQGPSFVASDGSAKAEKVGQGEALRSIQMDAPFYDMNSIKENSVADSLEQEMSLETDATDRVNKLAVYAGTTSAQDVAQLEADGVNVMDTEVDTVVTMVDRIKLALAKGGADISSMGGLDDAVIEELTDTAAIAASIEKKLAAMDLPVGEELSKEISSAVYMATSISPDHITENSAQYLLTNGLEPTIEQVYKGNLITSVTPAANEFAPEGEPDESMLAAFEGVIAEADQEATAANIADCQWMLEKNVPVTAQNLEYLQQLKDLDLNLSAEQITEIISDAVYEGKSPTEAVYISDYSQMAQAREALAFASTGAAETSADIAASTSLEQITSARLLQEARLEMTVEATYTLIKNGISVDTSSMADMVEQLQQLEQKFLEELLAGESAEQTSNNINMYETMQNILGGLSNANAGVLTQLTEISSLTITQVSEISISYEASFETRTTSATFERLQQSYEALWTAPRADMGDSIQKAFANVDDILQDLDFDVNDSNRRAVRILAYNQEEITPEAISDIRAADEQVQRLFSALKPATVMEMIREGDNPLDMTIADLTQTAENMGSGTNSDAEGFAEFLWQLEQTGGISEDERSSYIGIYRLIHQVEAGDGAAIGALLAQGAEVTLRNLMTAVRSGKHTGRDYTVDDDFGGIEGFDKSTLSITDQIEMAYQSRCLTEAGESLTPARLQQLGPESNYLGMTPEGFRDTLLAAGTPEVQQAEQQLQEAYDEELRLQLSQALDSEEQVYALLERNQVPQTANTILAMSDFFRDRNGLYRNLASLATAQTSLTPQDAIDEMIDILTHRFGEAVKTPEEMAEAQRQLEEVAENAMRDVLIEKDVTSIDVRGMKLITTQITTLGQISDHSETYNIPIMVADEAGTLSLKIVRGTHDAGMVDVTLNLETTGNVYASFRYEAGELNGQIDLERASTNARFAEGAELIMGAMVEETGLPVNLRFNNDRSTDANDIFAEKDYGFEVSTERDEVSTTILYGAARSFIDAVSRVLNA